MRSQEDKWCRRCWDNPRYWKYNWCFTCLKQSRDEKRARRAMRREQGLCSECGAKAVQHTLDKRDKGKLCLPCKESKRKSSQRSRKKE